MQGPSFKARFLLNILDRTTGTKLVIEMPNGDRRTFGSGEKIIYLTVRRWEVFDLVTDKVDLGLAEAIINGDLEVSDEAALIEWACNSEQQLQDFFRGSFTGFFLAKVKHFLNRNTVNKAAKNISKHYDLGNDFYRQWLDPTLTYSSGIFSKTEYNLRDSQINKYDRIIEKLQIKSSDHVLEIGCGWGGFFSRAAETTGCKITGITISKEQALYSRNLISQKNLDEKVDIQVVDYRNIKSKYNKIVSIEMIEAVGLEYWDLYFSKISESLKEGGKALIQGITIREDLFDAYVNGTDFIQQYIFPGGMLITDKILDTKAISSGLKLAENYKFGLDYAKTLKIWRENFTKALPQIRKQGFDEKFIRMWTFYLAYCEGAFRAQRIDVSQFLLEN